MASVQTVERRGRRGGVAAALLGAAIVISPVASALAAETLIIAAVSTPKGLDGDIFVPSLQETVINVYEGLTEYGMRPDGKALDLTKVIPHLAESWTISPDARTHVFKLRNAKSFFGKELSADDVIFTWEKSASQKRTGNFIRNVSNIETIEKVSDKEVKFTLKAPNNSFMRALQIYVPSVYDSKTVKERGATADDPYGIKWIANNTAGYGAYHVESIRPGEGSVMVANPNYFGPKVFFDRVLYREVPSASNRAALVRNGNAHWAEQVPLQQIPSLLNDPKVKVEMVVGSGSAMIPMNAKYPPFDDVRVRRALQLATDYEAIGKTVFLGLGTRSLSNLPPDMPGYKPVYNIQTDYAAAKKLLAEAGHPNGIDVTLEYTDIYWWEEGLVLQAAESMKNGGIRVTPKRVPSTDFRGRIAAGQRTIPLLTGFTTALVWDPGYQFYLSLHPDGSFNTNAYTDPRMVALVEKMVVEQNPVERQKQVEAAQQLYVDDAVAVETFLPGTYAVMAACIKGWVWRPTPHAYFRALRCEKS